MTPRYISSDAYNFAEFVLEHDSLRLFRRGEEIHLPPLSGRLLLALVARAPGTLTYERITKEVWGGRHVSHATITQRVKLLRRALGDHAEEPDYIALVRGSGYRFIPPVEHVTSQVFPAVPSKTSRVYWRTPATAVLLVAALVITGWTGMYLTTEADESEIAELVVVPPEAKRAFEQGKVLFHRRGEGDVQRAQEYFERAIALAPEYADPWVLLAGVYRVQAWLGEITLEESYQAQSRVLNRALILDPGLLDAQVRLAELEWSATGATEVMRQSMDQVLEVDPLHPLALVKKAQILHLQGDWEGALELREQAAAQRPSSFVAQNNVATHYLLMGELGRAEEILNSILDIHPNQSEMLALLFTHLRLLQSRPDEAMVWADKISPDQERLAMQALAYHLAGESKKVQSALQQLRQDPSPFARAKVLEIEYFSNPRTRDEDSLGAFPLTGLEDAEQYDERGQAIYNLLLSPLLDWSQRRDQWLALYRQISEVSNMKVAAISPVSEGHLDQ